MLTLWNLKFSHYVEKARWALGYKGLEHAYETLDSDGTHADKARELTGGRHSTFPVLVLEDGETVGDSTAIIARLEALAPEPALYPADADQRRRALELEDLFDEQLGPAVRIAVMDRMLDDVDLFVSAFMPGYDAERRAGVLAFRDTMPGFVRKRFRIDEESLAAAYATFAEVGERVRGELTPDGYLDPGGFSVADLTLAAMVSPIVCPVQFPYEQPQRDHPLLDRPRAALTEAGIAEWAEGIYARHRVPAPR